MTQHPLNNNFLLFVKEGLHQVVFIFVQMNGRRKPKITPLQNMKNLTQWIKP